MSTGVDSDYPVMDYELRDWYIEKIVIPWYHKMNIMVGSNKELAELRFRNILLVVNNQGWIQEAVLAAIRAHHKDCQKCRDYYK